jgi:hypothetical protein
VGAENSSGHPDLHFCHGRRQHELAPGNCAIYPNRRRSHARFRASDMSDDRVTDRAVSRHFGRSDGLGHTGLSELGLDTGHRDDSEPAARNTPAQDPRMGFRHPQVETEGELAVVRRLGIRYAQGYHLAHPATIDGLADTPRRRPTSPRVLHNVS